MNLNFLKIHHLQTARSKNSAQNLLKTKLCRDCTHGQSEKHLQKRFELSDYQNEGKDQSYLTYYQLHKHLITQRREYR